MTDARGKKFTGDFGDLPITVIQAATLGSGIMGKISGVTGLAFGIMQAQGLLKRLKPTVVVGFGGYPSFPAVFAAQRKKIPTIIHEQNAILGRANSMLAGKADRIALSMSHIHGLEGASNTETAPGVSPSSSSRWPRASGPCAYRRTGLASRRIHRSRSLQ